MMFTLSLYILGIVALCAIVHYGAEILDRTIWKDTDWTEDDQ